ncbi:hypothetical protein Nans01_16090 [Nocardiopsis ansamitocini]|uniref:DUF202 domain-containing protein n=1 Tax=Nocardiopsis ansamitocini TaxID=1670832 RepID=A0A9W6P592_9ACTN|nr:hypothetical protein Nans01_16090 [Nocardiopsis ansamitocini]
MQPERTLLSWQRTVFLLVGVALLYLRGPLVATGEAFTAQLVSRALPVLAVALVAVVVIVHLRRRWRRTDHGLLDDATGSPPAPLARPWAILLISGSVILLSTAVVLTAVPG